MTFMLLDLLMAGVGLRLTSGRLPAVDLGTHTWILSPWVALLPSLLILGAATCWARYLVGDQARSRIGDRLLGIFYTVTATLAAIFLLFQYQPLPRWINLLCGLTVLTGFSVLVIQLLLERPTAEPASWMRAQQRFFRWILTVTAIFASLAFLDTLGWNLAWRMGTPMDSPMGKLPAHLLGLGGLFLLLGTLLPAGRKASRRILPLLLAGVLLLALLGLASALSHGLWWPDLLPTKPLASRTWGVFATVTLLSLVLGRLTPLLNLTTFGPTYTAALTRAYPGASHDKRWRDGDATAEVLPGDDLPWHAYRPWERGGPLHLLNTTLNETTGGRSQVVQQDRKGMNLAMGPAGLSVGVRHHAAWTTKDQLTALNAPKDHSIFPKVPFHPDPLSLGQWVGISGAAVSTGLGSATQMARSLLTGFFNVRLGHWWRWTDHPPKAARGPFQRLLEAVFPVQIHLLQEWTARFPGTASGLWNLTDGGHFENTAAYELIRRRLPLILISDNGHDPQSRMGDLANLVAKARTDFQTEIRFLDAGALSEVIGTGPARRAFGTLDEILDPGHTAVATLARLEYPDSRGLLVILKPCLAPDLPLDLRDYREAHPDFPQESTANQFFSERQWEAYRKLGETIALRTLGGTEGTPAPWIERAMELATSAGVGAAPHVGAPASGPTSCPI